MIGDKRVVVVMPAFNAEKTIEKTYKEVMDQKITDLVIVTDDASTDRTVNIAKNLDSIILHVHENNKGYGANQKTCYRLALSHGADIVIMVHPDYQYTPKLIPAMAFLVASGLYDCVLGSRILGGKAVKGGMPLWKYFSNRVLTLLENWLLLSKLSEFHTGYRAYSATLLKSIPFEVNSDDFVFDNQILAQILWGGYNIGEISCPAKYFPEASSINFKRSLRYGVGCIRTGAEYRLSKWGIMKSPLFEDVKR